MAAVIKAGRQNGAGTVNITLGESAEKYHTSVLKLMNRLGTDASVKLNGHTVTLPPTMVEYEDFYIDVTTFEVVAGDVYYVAIG